MARILVIDTNKQFGGYVCTHLQHAGHTCLLENRGARALDMARKHNVDLILSEVMLADVCGFEVCRRVRAHPDLFTLPVILMSTMASDNEIQHGLTQGADDYLAKPFEPSVLTTRVSQQLQIAGDALTPDPITGLASVRLIKAVIQQAITQKQDFAAAYVELENIVQFGKMAGIKPRDKALRHVSRVLDGQGKRLASPLFRVAHIGVGHFVCVMESKHAVPYCTKVANTWNKHLPDFYKQAGMAMPGGDKGSGKNTPLLDLVICVADSGISGACSAKEYFDVLAQLRQKAVKDGHSGLFMDKRKAPRKKRVAS